MIRVYIDFGSTFTKAAAFDVDSAEPLIARVQSASTVDSDVTIGLMQVFDMLRKVGVPDSALRESTACSSAGGGLGMVCVGLVPDYTTKAAHLAALGAGAKVTGTFSYELSRTEVNEIARLSPDIILLTGGTDGGNKQVITQNARRLCEITDDLKTVIVAGNKSAYDDIKDIFSESALDVHYTENVMPDFGILDLDPVNRKIREIFIASIMTAKGIKKAEELTGGVIMPTPSAVLEAAKLLSGGAGSERGYGELLLIDVGGATTDIYSISEGTPTRDGVHMSGLREPYAKRTVEGDLGLYHNLDALANIAAKEENNAPGVDVLRSLLGVPTEPEKYNQIHLARLAVKTAVNRHAGRLTPVATHNGDILVQKGKDLSKIGVIIGAGGPLAFSSDPSFVLDGAVYSDDLPHILKPCSPRFFLDVRYILYAIGLMSQTEPVQALRIAKRYLKIVDKKKLPHQDSAEV